MADHPDIADISEDLLAEALALWPDLEGGSAALLHVSENVTFRIDLPDDQKRILRISRPGYQSRQGLEAEVALIRQFRNKVPINVPQILPGMDGDPVQSAPVGQDGSERFLTLFTFEPGEQVGETNLTPALFARLGEVAACAHTMLETWSDQPASFRRHHWVPETILPASGLWGDWRTAPGVDRAAREILVRAQILLNRRLQAFGKDKDRFGLIHADMHGQNLLQDGENLTLIDFDDSGFSWHLYDFAAAQSFVETAPQSGDWREAWISAYTKTRPLPPAHRDELDSMVLLRRMALLAWIGSHQGTGFADAHGANFAAGTCSLAETYLTNW